MNSQVEELASLPAASWLPGCTVLLLQGTLTGCLIGRSVASFFAFLYFLPFFDTCLSGFLIKHVPLLNVRQSHK